MKFIKEAREDGRLIIFIIGAILLMGFIFGVRYGQKERYKEAAKCEAKGGRYIQTRDIIMCIDAKSLR